MKSLLFKQTTQDYKPFAKSTLIFVIFDSLEFCLNLVRYLYM